MASTDVQVSTQAPAKASAVGPLLKVTILALIAVVAFSSRLFAVVRFESIIHEFDPWFNYRATKELTDNGVYEFWNWFDATAWYPLGRIVGGTVYPGLMVTSGSIHYILNFLLHIPIHIRDVCVFLAPLFSALTAFAMYAFTKEVWDDAAGLFAAAFIGIIPGYISRSVAGSYDNEGIAIFLLMLTYYFWIKGMKTGSLLWSGCCALAYFYMVGAWGGYVFITNLIPLHVLSLMLTGNFSMKVYTAYSTWYILGLVLSMQIPFVGFLPLKTSEHMAAFGMFGLCQIYAFVSYIQERMTKSEFQWLAKATFYSALALTVPGLAILTKLGYVAPFSGRFYSLWDTGYAKIHIPIIASVSEHQPTTWTSFFMDLHVVAAFFPAGLYLMFKNLKPERYFVILYAVTGTYFAGVMVRLMLTLTPIVVVCAAVAFSTLLKRYMERPPSDKKEEEASHQSMQSLVVALLFIFLAVFALHCTWVTSNAYSSPSVVLATNRPDGSRNILDDFREAYYWLRMNTDEDATVMSWWDYGYQIAGFANRTTLVDNNTWNNSHIALVGMAMSSNESRSYELMQELGVDYVLVIFGGMIGYSGDDINKFLWMVRIAQGEHPNEIKEKDYFTASGEYKVDANAPERMTRCLMYKLSYYRFSEIQLSYSMPSGYDRTRGYEIGYKDFDLTHVEEAFTSENWLVRIYRVLKPHELGANQGETKNVRKPANAARETSKSSGDRHRGSIQNKVEVVKPKSDSHILSEKEFAKRQAA
eukprot:m.164637 g.164637  ORF g.164637 m.164637 type:complete len:756 (-) comp14405_c0_seq1:277-2544(-)